MAELVDALDLGSSRETCTRSSRASRTNKGYLKYPFYFCKFSCKTTEINLIK